MIERLSKLRLPIDDLVKEFGERLNVPPRCPCSTDVGMVTLDLVQDIQIVQAARKYITKLLEKKEQYGYLYFLNSQTLLIELDAQFKTDLFIECAKKKPILQVLKSLASEFAVRDTQMYEITLVELLYFFILLVNPSLSWIAVESMLQCVKWHAHLIMSTDRPFSWREVIKP